MLMESPVKISKIEATNGHTIVNRLERVLFNRVPSLRGKQMYFVPVDFVIPSLTAIFSDVMRSLFPTEEMFRLHSGQILKRDMFEKRIVGEWNFRLLGGTTMEPIVINNKLWHQVDPHEPPSIWSRWKLNDLVFEISSREHGCIHMVCMNVSDHDDTNKLYNVSKFLCISEDQKKAYLAYTKSVLEYEIDCTKQKDLSKRQVISVANNGANSFPLTQNDDWDNLVLTPEVKSRLKEDFEAFTASKDWFARNDMPWSRGYLLVGPNGSGKTTLLRAMATCRQYSKSTHLHEGIDEGGNIGDLHTTLHLSERLHDPILLLIPSLDLVIEGDKVIGEPCFLTDSLKKADRYNGIVVVATAESVKHIDPALLAGTWPFNQIIYMDLPDYNIRYQRLHQLFQRPGETAVSAKTLKQMAEKTKGYTFSLLQELVIEAYAQASARGYSIIEDFDAMTALDVSLTRRSDAIARERKLT